jgi:hypothetical protein
MSIPLEFFGPYISIYSKGFPWLNMYNWFIACLACTVMCTPVERGPSVPVGRV